MKEEIPIYASESIRKILAAAVHLWLSGWVCETGGPKQESTYWVYSRDIGWGQEELRGKRVSVTISIEDDQP